MKNIALARKVATFNKGKKRREEAAARKERPRRVFSHFLLNFREPPPNAGSKSGCARYLAPIGCQRTLPPLSSVRSLPFTLIILRFSNFLHRLSLKFLSIHHKSILFKVNFLNNFNFFFTISSMATFVNIIHEFHRQIAHSTHN